MKFLFLSSSLSFSLTLTPHNPHTLAPGISLIELQRCACPQNVPIALSAKKKKKKTFFRHGRSATFCFTQLQSLFLFLTLTSTNADNCWTEAQFCTEENYTPCCD